MSDDESRHENHPMEGGKIFAENGTETLENDQTGLPSWAAALTAQLQTAVRNNNGVTRRGWVWGSGASRHGIGKREQQRREQRELAPRKRTPQQRALRRPGARFRTPPWWCAERHVPWTAHVHVGWSERLERTRGW